MHTPGGVNARDDPEAVDAFEFDARSGGTHVATKTFAHGRFDEFRGTVVALTFQRRRSGSGNGPLIGLAT